MFCFKSCLAQVSQLLMNNVNNGKGVTNLDPTALYPLQKDGQEGRGLFRCTGQPTIRNDTFGQGIEDFQ